MDEVRIVDSTLRDGDISLWSYGMTTGTMPPALPHIPDWKLVTREAPDAGVSLRDESHAPRGGERG